MATHLFMAPIISSNMMGAMIINVYITVPFRASLGEIKIVMIVQEMNSIVKIISPKVIPSFLPQVGEAAKELSPKVIPFIP